MRSGLRFQIAVIIYQLDLQRMSESQDTILKDNASSSSMEVVKKDDKSNGRQDAYVVFSNEKDLRHNEAIRIKASLYTGIAVRVKVISPAAMENLLHAIDIDAGLKNQMKAKGDPSSPDKKGSSTIAAADLDESAERKELEFKKKHLPKAGILNLRFEECKIQKKAASILSEWLKEKAMISTIGMIRVTFEDAHDFKKITEGVRLNSKLLKISFHGMNFDEEIHGTAIGRILNDSRTIRELDMTQIVFDYRSFYDMCQAILAERCRLNIFKLRGIQIGEIEGKIIQFILMKNKTIHTLDLSESRTDDPENFEYFCEKLNQFCNIRFLTMEKMQPELSQNMETIGESLADNNKLEVLILRDNRIKWSSYQNFFVGMMPNRTLQKLNLCKTELTDRVVEKLAQYLDQEGLALMDLDISKNAITDVGLKTLSNALRNNTALKFLNLSANKIKDEGLTAFANMLEINTVIHEVSFAQNIISNDGIGFLAQMLPLNNTLRHLDLSKNAFNDSGFEEFALLLAENDGLDFLDIAKNKDVTDEGSLLTLVEALSSNERLKTLDLTGLNIRKPFLKMHFDQALKRNITLQEVIGKIPANIINAELEYNIIIEKELLPLYTKHYRAARDCFSLALVESDPSKRSRLNLKDQPARLHKAAFKLIRKYDIRSVDFTNSSIHDDGMRMLSQYLRGDPNLRSIVLDNNMFTDEGLFRLTKELQNNTKVAHLSIKGCSNLTNDGLQKLCNIISTTNTSLFQIDLSVDQFDQQLAMLVITESALNRDIQEKLKPIRVTTELNSKGDVIKVTHGHEQALDSMSLASPRSSDCDKSEVVDPFSPLSHNTFDLAEQVTLGEEMTEIGDPTSPQVKQKLSSKKLVQPEISRRTGGALKVDEEQKRTIIEVKFDENACVAESFHSAIKAWRIHGPNIITLENQQLSDEHAEKLCEFLANREMITHLNLRRNQIGNAGAKCIGIFIQEQDHTLTHLDITRNYIGQDGGQVILDALYATTRMIECSIQYGNPISNKMGRIIDREIKANIQADSYANKSKETGGTHHNYELIDKGPDFMRCAIKMTQLHNILFLSLPDNMLALEDARMLAQLLQRNTPLRKLNLQDNQLDADCAALIANSLLYNDQLEVLNVSRNLLGDLGVYLILTPLIRKSLILGNIVSKSVPTLREKVLAQEKDVKFSKRVLKNIDIMSELQYISLQENQTTLEVYKQVWLLLEANQNIIIKVDNPVQVKARGKVSLFNSKLVSPRLSSQNLPITAPPIGASGKVAPINIDFDSSQVDLENSQAFLIDGIRAGRRLSDSMGEPSSQMEDSEDEPDEEALMELELLAIQKEKERQIQRKKERTYERKKRSIMCCQSLCCFKDEENDFNLDVKLPSYTQVCCWRFLRSRRQSTKFYTGENAFQNIETSGYSVTVSMLISFNYLMLYAVVIVPFVLIATQEDLETIELDDKEFSCDDKPDECALMAEEARIDFNNIVLLINMMVLIYSMICETIIICINLKAANTHCGSYLVCQVITGLTMRAVILISAQLIAVFIQAIDLVNFGLGVFIASTLILSQIRALQIWLAAMKKDNNCLMPRVRQNYRICNSTNYLAAATIYNKVSVEATERAIEQTKNLDAERELLMSFSGFADEDISSKANVKAKLAKRCKCCRWSSPKFYQLIMNDIPLIVCYPFAYIFGLMDNVNMAVGILIAFLDLCFMLFYLSYDEELSIDAQSIYNLAEKRIREKQFVIEKLMSEEVSIIEQDESRDQERSDNTISPREHSVGIMGTVGSSVQENRVEFQKMRDQDINITDQMHSRENSVEGSDSVRTANMSLGLVEVLKVAAQANAKKHRSSPSHNRSDIRVESIGVDDNSQGAARMDLPPIVMNNNVDRNSGIFQSHVV